MSVVSKSDKNLTVATVSSTSPSKSKPKPKVLDEDDYLEKLDSIIQRDFFPDLEKLKAQTEYLEAVERNDVEKIRNLQLRYSCRRTDKPLNSPRTPKYFETPLPTDKNKDASDEPQPSTSQKEPEPTSLPDYPDIEETPSEAPTNSKTATLGVDEFLTKYTSEDNASFEDIMERTEIKNRQKYEWMYKAEEEHKKKMQETLALAGADEQILAIMDGRGPRAASIQNWTYQSKNAVMFIPDGAEWSPEELVRRKKMTEREIVHENTRFTETPFSDDASKQTMSNAAITQSVITKGKVDAQGDDTGFKNPMQKFGFVATPSPAPGVNESPMMTWGEIEGTPFRLDAGDLVMNKTPGPTFKMPEIPLRDKLAQGLTDEISKRNREKKQAAINQVSRLTPKFGSTKSMERLATLSPAAQRLATSKLGIRVGTDKALKASYTPSPVRSIGDKTPTARGSIRQTTDGSDFPTPSSTRKRTSDGSESNRVDESLTDNLLQLKNKKPRASDFF